MLDMVWCTWQAATAGRLDLIGMPIIHAHPLRAWAHVLSLYGGIVWLFVAVYMGFVNPRGPRGGSWAERLEAVVIAGTIVAALFANRVEGRLY